MNQVESFIGNYYFESNKEKIEEDLNNFRKKIESRFDAAEKKKIFEALDMMLDVHALQTNRPDGKPYASHPLEVADKILDEYGIEDADLMIAAILHDSVEDQSDNIYEKAVIQEFVEEKKRSDDEMEEVAFQYIGQKFGPRVEGIVRKVSNPNFGAMLDELQGKGVEKTKDELYAEHIQEIISDLDAFVVKYADFSTNAFDINNSPNEERKRYLRNKYGPVIKDVFLPAFQSMPESHPLYPQREKAIAELEKVYKEQYS